MISRAYPKPQELYRHFKGNLYQILTIAIHSETREEMVVYQALYGDYSVYVRPLEMFLSEVDHNKYPDVTQKWRFEKVSGEESFLNPGMEQLDSRDDAMEDPMVIRPVQHVEPFWRAADTTTARNSEESVTQPISSVMSRTIEEEAEELNLDPNVVAFLDADSASARIKILDKLRPIVTNDMIDIMSMAIDVEIDEGDAYDRLEELKHCLATIERFEADRLRPADQN